MIYIVFTFLLAFLAQPSDLLLSWREPPWPTLFQKSIHRGAIWLSWAPGAQPGDAPLWAASVFGPFHPQGWRQHWSHYTAQQHEQKTGNQLRLLKHKPSTDKWQALSHPDQHSCETMWTKRPLGKGPLSVFFFFLIWFHM